MKTGLRTEIILSITLLLAAALLFAGFLMIKLTERELLEQQTLQAHTTIMMAGSILNDPQGEISETGDLLSARLSNLQSVFSHREDIQGWRLLDPSMQTIVSVSSGLETPFSDISPALLSLGRIHEVVVYSSILLSFGPPPPSYVELAYPLIQAGSMQGTLQVRFSLDRFRARVHESQRLVLIYVVGYGVVLALFGVYLLNRSVVQPVKRLQEATSEVAAGTLSAVVAPEGPGEIQVLAESFNHMVTALDQSRQETEAHITSLEQANRDLTQVRNDLIRSEKMASVGHLAAGMAHEIGNPLGAVVGYLNMLDDDLSSDESKDLLARSLAQIQRIDRLVRELLDYASPAAQHAESFNPVEVLREGVSMLQHQGALDGVDVVDECTTAPCEVCMDRTRLMQVWVNLFLNARDAMNGEGQLSISSRFIEKQICISIHDNGPGMSEEVSDQIFEPFYTTKDPGKGRGLGLAVCLRIIEDAGGHIDVESRQGDGTVFSVCLPCVEEVG